MIVVLYRWKVKAGLEKQFEESWAVVTQAFRDHCGSYGSRLHLNGDNEYVAYAQWPDLATRQACIFNDPIALKAREQMGDAISESAPEQILTVLSDLLVDPKKA